MNPTARICPACHQPLPADAPQGLCPQCLAKSALGSQPGSEETVASGSKPGGSGPATIQPEIVRLFPQLEIMEPLGQGGMGMVYKARQPQLDRVVALKVMRADLSRDPAFAERFAREARALAKLNHPNIVSVFDFGQTGGHCWFLMEFVDGRNLRELLRTKTLQPREALGIVPKVCDALQYAHDEGIVHRDIKPENILLDKKGRVKIADFGLAKLVGKDASDFSLTATGMTLGTPRYMAPEQFDKPQEVDHRADIYSLGVVLYEMLTGEVPMGRFAPPSATVGVDVRLDEVVLRSLEKEPSRRYQHASEVKTQVESIAGVVANLPPQMRQAFGFEYKTKTELFGLPLVHIASGMDLQTGKARVAKGIIAIGGVAKGVLAFGGASYGVFAFGGFAVGLFTCAGCGVGLISFAGLAVALAFAYGGLAIAPVALGGLAVGYYAFGGGAFGVHALGGNANDPEARQFFSWAMQNWKYVNIGGLVLMAISFIVPMVATIYARSLALRGTDAAGGSGPNQTSAMAAGQRGMIFGAVLTFLLTALISALLLASRSPKIDLAQETVSHSAANSAPPIFYTFAGVTHFRKGPDGPQILPAFAKELGLNALQIAALDKLLPKYYDEFLSLERRHTTFTNDVQDHVHITIRPFHEQTVALAERMNAEIRGVVGRDVLYPRLPGNLVNFGLFRHCGATTVTAELWKEGGQYHYREALAAYELPGEKHGEASRGGKGKDWRAAFPEEYWIYWNAAPTGQPKGLPQPASVSARPDFSGTWKLQSTETSEVFTFEHREPALRVVMRLGGDALGQRILDFSGQIDRQEHRQTVEGQPASLLAWWEGEELLLEIKRVVNGGVILSRRRMKLSADGKTITAQRSILSPGPERGWTEIWEKQAGAGSSGAALAPTATDLLRQMGEKYGSLKSFSASGKVVSVLTPADGGAARTNETTFSINLARPEFYRVMWTNRTGWGAAWSAGDGHRVLPYAGKAVSSKAISMLNREQTTASASGSLGTARTVPELFFKDETFNLIKSLTNPSMQAEESVGGEACHVITSASPALIHTLWIRKQDLLLKQYRTAPGSDYGKGPVRLPATSDEDLGKILKSTGQEATPEAVSKLRQQMNKGKSSASSTRTTFTVTYEVLKPNGLMIKEDFEVTVPAG